MNPSQQYPHKYTGMPAKYTSIPASGSSEYKIPFIILHPLRYGQTRDVYDSLLEKRFIEPKNGGVVFNLSDGQ